jgi:CRP/FNR family transcriptional regulator
VEGVVSVYKTDLKGNEILIHKFYPTSLIAERANLANMNFPASCKMDEDGVILKIDFLKFKQILTEPDICFKIMQSLLNKMNSLDDVIINMMLDTETKVAKFIYEKTETFESLKQHLIADLLNIKPETLSRKLKKFKEKGIIENNHSKIRVINKEKIKELFKW